MRKKLQRLTISAVLLVLVFSLSIQPLCVLAAETGGTATAAAAPVTIVTQPTSVTVAPGSTARVSVSATGTGLTYEWYFKDAGAAEFEKTTAYTKSTYSVVMNDARNGRQVYCKITDASGNSVTTDIATLHMEGTPKITKQPTSVVAAIGESARVSISAIGDGLTYQWYFKDSTMDAFELTTSYTGTTYSVKMSAARNNRQVYCVVTDASGNSVKSDIATLSTSDGVKIVTQPVSVVAAIGATARVQVKATGVGLTYQWYYKDAGSKEFSLTTSYTTDTYSVKMSAARNGRQLYCVITDKYGNSVKTDTVTLQVPEGVKITQQPSNGVAPEGSKATVTVLAEGEGLTYQWYFKNPGSSKFSLTTTFTTNKYSVVMSDARNGRQIYCVITDLYGNSVQTQTVTLYMGTPVEITKQPVSVVVPNGSTAKVTIAAKGDDLTYQWYYKNSGATAFTLTTSYTGTSYSVKMTAARSGRQVYCVVTDRYGNSVKSDVVTLSTPEAVKITKQPVSVTVGPGERATVTVEASGDGLTYQWYFKNATSKAFAAASAYTTNQYSVPMNETRDGRQVYCVITDQYGNSVKSDVVTLNMTHVHSLGDWVVIREATPEAEGIKRASCSCGYYVDESIAKVKAVRYLTLDLGNGETQKIGVGSNGVYYLTDPYRMGYNFVGWKDSKGNDFPATGTIAKNTKIYAKWEIDGTDTLGELYSRCAAGVDKILITADIVVTKAIFVPYQTTIYSDGDYTILRSPSYTGDIFVVGQDKNGNISVVNNHQAILTLGGGKGTLTIDGNRDNLTVKVVGSAIFASDSCVVNLYDGVCICNHMKLGNSRSITYEHLMGEYYARRVGGAAIAVLNSTLNMYGGVIENNKVFTEYTPVTNEDGTVSNYEYYGCGGAVFNYGNFNMYGGTIRNNEALRGGGVYNARFAYIEAGYISNNLSHSYGGAIASSSSANADTHLGNDDDIGTLIIQENHSIKAGGAVYSATNSPIVIYGNTEFIGNSTDSSGGAIYTSGGLTIRNTKFIGNTAFYSSGAVHHQYGATDRGPRYLEVTGCVFQDNVSSTGGAMCLSAGSADWGIGSIATITDCEFKNNQSIINTLGSGGSGGALYITRSSEATITDCTFYNNSAASSGGAIYIGSKAEVKLTDCEFTSNRAVNGGAVSASSNSKLTQKNISYVDNASKMTEAGGGGNGGALYIANAEVTFDTVSFTENTAANNAGALYISNCDVTLDKTCIFNANIAGNHGGAIYTTYTTLEDGTKDGTVLTIQDVTFENHSALAGGAISCRTGTELNVTDVVFVNNTTPGAKAGTINGGGAIYANNSNVQLTRVTFDKNSSGYYGGTLKLDACDSVISDCSITDSTGGTGGAIYASVSTMIMDKVTLTGCSGGPNGVIYLTCKEATLTNITAYNNYASGGGVVYANSGANVTVSDSKLTNNSASSGGALYVAGNSVMTVSNVEFTGNSAKSHGGAIYVIASTLNVGEGNTFTENTAGGNGGAIAAFDSFDETTQVKTPSHVSITGIPFESNTGSCGGAVYFNDSVYRIQNCTFTNNTSTSVNYGGGAVYNTGATGTIDNVTFTGNTAVVNGGAMALYTSSHVTVSNVTATNNTAGSTGGAFYSSNCQLDLLLGTQVFTDNSAANAGAIYASGSDLDLVNAVLTGNTATNNGGAVTIVGATLTITGENTVITGNSAGGHGGVIYASYNTVDGVKHGATVNITGITLEGNTALSGGAISGRTNTTMNLNDVVFKNNTTPGATTENGGGGGAIYSNNSVLNLSNVLLKENSSGYYGGAIMTDAAVVNLTNNTTLDANSGGTGAAMYLTSGSSMTATDLIVTNNISSANGVIYLNGTDFTFTNLTAHDNHAAWKGGVLYVNGGKSTVTVNDSALYDNDSPTGGVIYMANGALTVSGSSVYNNSGTTGGAIAAINGAQVNLVDAALNNNTASNGGAVNIQGAVLNISGNTIFDGNTATGHGGAIYISDYSYKANASDETYTYVDSTVSISGTVFSANTAARGGAIYVTGNQYTIENSVFERNTATNAEYGGGAIYSTGSHGVVTEVSFVNNSSVKGGAVALHSESTFTGSNVSASGNAAVVNSDGKIGQGGAFYVNNSTLTLSSTNGVTVIEGNTAVNGSAIYVANNGKINVDNMSFTGNTSTSSGGAIYATSAAVQLDNCDFTGNTGSTGGAVIVLDGEVVLNHTAFSENTSTSLGGALYFNGCSVVMNENSFTQNAAGSNGGAIYAAASTVEGSNNSFNANTAVGHGGAIYAVYATKNIDGTDQKVGTIMNLTDGSFENNTAMAGGAISIRTNCSVTLNGTSLTGNSVTGYADDNDGDGDGGGAIYVGYGAVTLNNVTAIGNTAESFGGVIDSYCGNVTIDGGTYTENVVGVSGGVIFADNKSTLTIIGATVTNNESTYENTEYNNSIGGGAIFINGGSLTVSSTELAGNATGYYGGAILANGATVTMDKNTVVRENTGVTGGALIFKSKTNATLTDVTISDNIASSNGVVYINNSTVTMQNVYASGNSAKSGGVIYVSNVNSTVDVLNSTFCGNTAKNGGVVYADSATVNFTDCSVYSNTADTSGGAVYVKSGKLTVSGSSLTENAAPSGGAIYALNSAAVTVSGTCFQANTATSGGALKIEGSELNIGAETSFLENQTTGNGGAVHITSYTVESDTESVTVDSIFTIESATFTGNIAGSGGGAIYMSNGSLTMTDASFMENQSTSNGGAVYLNAIDVVMNGNDFQNNTSGANGGAMDFVRCTVTGENNIFAGNTAAGHGGALYVVYGTVTVDGVQEKIGTNLTLTGGSFSGNTALYGGAISGRTNSVITLNDVLFDGNNTDTATQKGGGGGAIYANNTTLTLNGCILSKNSSGYYGGAIYTDLSHVVMTNTNVLVNSGATGGALYLTSGSSMEATDCLFSTNTSSANGVIYLNGNSFVLTNVNATANSAKWNGGVFYINGSKTEVTLDGCNISDNTSGKGGAIHVINGKVDVTGSTLSRNTADEGGAIYMAAGTVNLTNSMLYENTAVTGGAVYVAGGELNTSANLNNNTATESGGAIYAGVGTVNVTGGQMAENTASTGGAIHVINGVQLNIGNAIFVSNTAETGAALRIEGANLTISGNTEFSYNTATGNGGAIHIGNYTYTDAENADNSFTTKSNVSIDGAVFAENTAAQGGAIYVTGNAYTVKNTTFVDNTATAESYGGGAIYSTGGTGELDNVTFTGNTSVKGGAVALHSKSVLTVTSMTASGNAAIVNSESKQGVGGVFYVNNATLNLNGSAGSIVMDNNTAVSGAAIHATNGAVVNVSGSSFTGNASTDVGGAVYLYDCTAVMNDNSFIQNTSNTNGGAIYVAAGTLEGSGNVFTENSAVNHGGAIYAVYVTKKVDGTDTKVGAVVNLTGGSFESNAAMAGGAISIRTNCSVTLDGTSLTNNTVSGYAGENDGDGDGGGAIYVGYGNVTLNNVTATGNAAESYGGVVDAYYGEVTITGGSYSNNTAAIGGGVIYAPKGYTVTISGATFTGNSTTDTTVTNTVGGGVIQIGKGTLVISDSIFDGNSSKYYGGVLLAGGSDVTISGNTVLKNNSGKTGAVLYFKNSCNVTMEDVTVSDNTSKGNGVIYINSGSLTMTNVTASGNTAYSGGVLYISNGSTVVTINDPIFTGNTATATGGAICLSSGTVNINGGEMKQNTAAQGGAIYNNAGTVNITDTVFSENEASGELGGSAIAVESGTVTGTNVTLADNTAANYGGAIYMADVEKSDGTVAAANVTLSNSTISGNTAANGGAMYAVGGNLELNSCTVTNNAATKHGGAIYAVDNAVVNIAGGAYTSNSATGNGGAVLIEGANLTIGSDASFSNNSATGNGGAIYVCDYVYTVGEETTETVTVDATFAADGASFAENTASRGGAVFVGSNTYTLSNVSFANNTATEESYGGGAIYNTDAISTLSNITFTGNSSVKGGAVALHTNSNMTVSGLTATGNSAVANSEGKLGVGGVFYINNATLTLNGAEAEITVSENTAASGAGIYAANSALVNADTVLFDGNTSGGNGGALYAGDCETTLVNCQFTSNSATGNGGACYIVNNQVAISGCTFSGCSATSNGGAVYIYNVTASLADNTFADNTAGSNGGAMDLVGCTVTMTGDNAFVNNAAANHGGALYIVYYTVTNEDGTKTNIPTVLNMTGGSFTGNTAIGGGAVSIRTACSATFEGTAFLNNSVAGYAGENDGDGDSGAVIYVGFGEVTLNNVTATGNTAENFGGVVNAYNGVVNISGGTFSQNSANAGGVIHASSKSTITITDAAFSSNTAVEKGGAIYMNLAAKVTVTGGSFEGNTVSGGDGGAIYVADTSSGGKNATTLTISGVTLKNNSASAKGGALSTDTASVNLVINATNCVFEANSSGAGGGAVEIQNGNCNSAEDPTEVKIVFTNCTFTNNAATTTGGAIEIRNQSCAKFIGITATGNSAKQHGGVIYVTSNYSRLYLTGTVTISDNTVGTKYSGTFVYLYNNNYSNAPKIYTTDNSSAAWYSEVGGNKTNVAFDLTTLP